MDQEAAQFTLDGKVVPLHKVRPAKRPENDPIWDALEEIFNYQARTFREKREFGHIVRSFKAAGATVDELHDAAKAYKQSWPDVDLTMYALEKWFGHMLAKGKPRKSLATPPCSECGVGGGHHTADCPTVVPGPPHQLGQQGTLLEM